MSQVTREFYLLSAMVVFCFALLALRIHISKNIHFIFLIWNLFLAGIPWILGQAIRLLNNEKSFISMILIALYILFLPNSAYILTDLIHLQERTPIPLWYDLILILSFAWTGLIFGLLSLSSIELFLNRYQNKSWTSFTITTLLFVIAFGIYLGRFLRWNSWDILEHPGLLFFDIFARIINPLEHPATWGVTLGLGCLLNFIYWSMRLYRNTENRIAA